MPRRVTYANVMSTFATVVALGTGSAYAVSQLPAHSVGTKQLANSSVTGKKVKNGSLKAIDFKAGSLPAGPKGDKGDKGAKGDQGDPGVASFLATYTNINMNISANTCIKGTLTDSRVAPGDTVIPAPDYNGTWPVSVTVTPGRATVNGSMLLQFCNHSAVGTGNVTNQTMSVWVVKGP